MSDETDGMHVFQRYSKDGCDLENKMHFAVESCGYCVPWNVPMMSLLIPDNVSMRFCDAFEHRCMDAAIASLDTPYHKVSGFWIKLTISMVWIGPREDTGISIEQHVSKKSNFGST